jgi:hypothetical protein
MRRDMPLPAIVVAAVFAMLATLNLGPDTALGALETPTASPGGLTPAPTGTVQASTPAVATTTPTPTSQPKAGPFVVIVRGDRLNLPVDDRTRPGVRDMATFMGGLTVFANGTACDSLDFSKRPANSTADGVLRVGLPSQPGVCSQAGAKVTFRQTRGNAQLITVFTMMPGETAVLDNFGIEPPTTGDEATQSNLPRTGGGAKSASESQSFVARSAHHATVPLAVLGSLLIFGGLISLSRGRGRAH